MKTCLNKFAARLLSYNSSMGIFLILLFGIPRFILVLHSYMIRSYGLVMFVFFVMWFTPFLFLNKTGRKDIALNKPDHFWTLPISFLAGGVICYLLFLFFSLLYDQTIDNAFVYIAGNNAINSMSSDNRDIYFLIAVIPSMLFSPIGEEFLYRGIIHGSFVSRFGERGASILDSLAFAVTHIAHFGILYVSGIWIFSFIPALIWVFSMFVACQVFFQCKQFSRSLWGAVASHAGFNFMMMYIIFYILL